MIAEKTKLTKKVGEITEKKECRDSEHKPPTMVVYEPGIYEHTCPSCGEITNFTVAKKPTL